MLDLLGVNSIDVHLKSNFVGCFVFTMFTIEFQVSVLSLHVVIQVDFVFELLRANVTRIGQVHIVLVFDVKLKCMW